MSCNIAEHHVLFCLVAADLMAHSLRVLNALRPRASAAAPSWASLQATRFYSEEPPLKGSQTEHNLKLAFSGESMANRRYLYFAQRADIEGFSDVAQVFRSTAEGETGHALGHMQYLEEVGDPATDEPIGSTADNLNAAIVGETHEYTDMYPGMAKVARDEGFDDVADWFETLARAEKSHAGKFQRALEEMEE